MAPPFRVASPPGLLVTTVLTGMGGADGGDGDVFNSSRLKVSWPISCMERPFEPKGGGGVGEGCSLVTDPCVSVVVPSSKVTKRL